MDNACMIAIGQITTAVGFCILHMVQNLLHSSSHYALNMESQK